MNFETILGAWVATGLTLFIFTFLYKDNPLFKLAEHLYVGISVGYTIVKAWDTVVIRLIYEPMVKQGDWTLAFPLFIGLLMLARYAPKAAWMSRIAFAFVHAGERFHDRFADGLHRRAQLRGRLTRLREAAVEAGHPGGVQPAAGDL